MIVMTMTIWIILIALNHFILFYNLFYRAPLPPSKKMLGFVLKAEENRNLTQEKKTNGCSGSEQQDDKLLTATTNGGPIAERDQEDERLWTLSSNGYPEPNQQPSDRLWTPPAYDSVLEKTPSLHRKLELSLSYDAWLEKKRQSATEVKTERPASATLKSKVGREMDVAAFKQWLEGKKKFRKRSKSETLTIEHHRAGSGAPFEEWLRQKRQQLNGKLYYLFIRFNIYKVIYDSCRSNQIRLNLSRLVYRLSKFLVITVGISHL